ncbi:hypothetical protein HVIM_04643 [Roseomonas mucosa]|nr:hypothetical protein HVIM_04643 [Roseomonas mucosa]QDE01788.1 hypothetical protein ADP8_04643 [Roseomonas mucosa]UZO94074.1 hypothetical protein RMP42_04643 [Roseomonas mucosa]
MKADRAERCLPRYGFRDYRPEAVFSGTRAAAPAGDTGPSLPEEPLAVP